MGLPPEWQRLPAFSFVENNPALPNVLIYGDSISVEYTSTVRDDLKDKANVYRIHCNGGSSGSFIPNMTKMDEAMRNKQLEGCWSFQWDVIHFNVGLHDLKYIYNGQLDKTNGTRVCTVENYEKNLRAIIAYLKKTSPGATLIFATTTPVPEGEPGRVAGDSVIYNEAALRVMKDYPEIIVNDLYSFTNPHRLQWWTKPGNVHYKPEGAKAQGDEVSGVILKALKSRPTGG
jgi:hypothetical protein